MILPFGCHSAEPATIQQPFGQPKPASAAQNFALGYAQYRCVFFNDLMIVSDRDGDIDLIKRSLSEKYGSITCKESRRFKYLGMDIERFPGEIKISMPEYIADVTHGVTRTFKTPASRDN
jgi:hypothetical protein